MEAIKVKLIGLSRGGGGNLQPDKTATPTEQTQIVQPDPGYDGLRQVTVGPIPDEYADVSGVDAGAGDVRVGKVIVGSDGETITGTMPPQKPEEVGHATPTEQAQTVTPTAGSVFSEVVVDAIPSEYADVSSVDATAADVRTGKTIVDASGAEVTGVMEPQKPEQVKSATPTASPQSVTPDTGYALSRVDVGAIPSEYADVSDVTATAGTVLTGSDFVDASGTLVHGSCDYDADTSDATATAGQIEAGATAYVGGTKLTGTMPIRTTDVEISDLSPVPIPAGSYDGTTASAKLSSAAAASVVASNIRQGAEILGVQGNYQGVDTLGQMLAGTLTKYVNNTYVGDGSEGGAPTWLFSHCWSLQEIQMDAMLSVPTSFLEAYTTASSYPGQNLQKASFAAATTINKLAFAYCSYLSVLNIPSVVTIGDQSFQSAGDKVVGGGFSAVCPNCTSLGQRAFYQSRLVAVDMPALVTLGGNVPFQSCARLSSVNLPNLTTIGTYYNQGAFDSCSALTILDFPKLTSIAGAEFQKCTNLATLILRADTVCTLSNANSFQNSPFASNGSGGTLYVPQAQIANYQSATNWSVILAYTNNQILPIEGSPYEVTT